jgi:hypothetical protein
MPIGRTGARSLADHVAAIGPLLPAELVPPAAIARIKALPDSLPPFRWSVFECRLGDGRAPVDFAWKYTPADLQESARLPVGEAWRRFARFRTAWVEPCSSFARHIRAIGLEFDLDKRPGPATLPSIFFGFADHDPDRTRRTIDSLLELFDRPQTAASRAAFLRCARALPAASGITYVGLMLGRDTPGLRLGLQGMGRRSIVPYLREAGWPRAPDQLETFLRTLEGDLATSTPVVALDVHDAVAPRVGLEFILAHPQAVRADRARTLLDHLVGLGLCTALHRDAALAWPSSRSPYDVFMGQPARTISHVKIVCSADGSLGAKCYLEAAHA